MAVEFEEDSNLPRAVYRQEQQPAKIVRLLMKTGMVKTEEAANKAILGASIFALAIAGYLFISVISGPKKIPPHGEIMYDQYNASISKKA